MKGVVFGNVPLLFGQSFSFMHGKSLQPECTGIRVLQPVNQQIELDLMFPPPSNHAKHSSTVVIYHVPIFPTSSEDHTVCEMDRVTLLFLFFAYCRHMSVAIHRCQMKEAQSVFFGKHMLVAPRQKDCSSLDTQFHSILSLNFSLSLIFHFFFQHLLKLA